MEMKRIVVVVIINLILCVNGRGQNLVPNGGFENIDSCNFGINCWAGVSNGLAPPWDSPTGGSPDLFNTCCTRSYCRVPSVSYGFQYAHTGNGYVGEEVYQSNNNVGREYIQAPLDSILLPQHKYCVAFYVSLSNDFDMGTNNIGMYFSSTHTHITSLGTTRLNLIPQIIDTSIVSDTANWTLISGQYIASGGEQYIIIGNFNTYQTIDTLSLTYPSPGGSYYYIDDVSIVDCTTVGINDLTKENEITISPNPAATSITITSSNNIKVIKLINLLGEVVLIRNYELGISPSTPLRVTDAVSVDISSASKGIYFVEITDVKENVINRKVVVQ